MSIEKAYDSWSEIYDTNENKTRDLDKVATSKTLSKYDFDKVIELGCGTGKNTVWLVENAKEIIALDFSQKMLDIAQQKIKDSKVSFIKTDLNSKWNVPDKFADLITCSLTLEHIENLDPIFKQAYKKLNSNGKFFVCELHAFKQYLGSKARYKTAQGTQELEVFTHHITDYLNAASKSGFELIELKEWFDKPDIKNDSASIPRLISFVFEKNHKDNRPLR